MIVVGFIVIAMAVMMGMSVADMVLMAAAFAVDMIVAAAFAVGVSMVVSVVMVMIVGVVIVLFHEIRIARISPQDDAAHQREEGESDAAGEDVGMELLAEDQGEHRWLRRSGLPEPEAQADGAERAAQRDHAELVDEVGVALVVVMVVRVGVLRHRDPPLWTRVEVPGPPPGAAQGVE